MLYQTRSAALVYLAMLLGLASCGCDMPGKSRTQVEDFKELNFGIIATESTIGLKNEFDPFLEDMSAALGIPVKSYFASDYAGVIEAMRFGKVDLGWFGNKSAIEAADRAGGEVFVQTVPLEGEPGYWSVIIVHADSTLHTVDDLIARAKELSFGNGDPHSTSGFLIPSYYLWRKLSIDPKQTFKSVINSNHETNALSVANKQVDFATCSTEVLAQIEQERPETFKKLRVIWKSPLIPSDPFVWRTDLPQELKTRILDFILEYGREGPDRDRHLEVLAHISAGWAPFRPSSNDQLLPLREMILANKIDELERKANELNTSDQAELKAAKAKLLEVQQRQRELQPTTAE